MAEKPKTVVTTGGGAYIGGNAHIEGGKFVGRDDYSQQGLSLDDVKALFQDIESRVESHPNLTAEDRADIKAELEELIKELTKGEKMNESFVQRRLRNLGRMAPDILEVTLATIANPVAGLGVAAKKIAEKIKSTSVDGAK
ncbi:MAG TPA: hypothetical protein PKM21_07450 [Anaerolineales bacterium]|nr:hypothetical protein [Anaerolineales bacterium]